MGKVYRVKSKVWINREYQRFYGLLKKEEEKLILETIWLVLKLRGIEIEDIEGLKENE